MPKLLDCLEGRLNLERDRAVETAVAAGDRAIPAFAGWDRAFRTRTSLLPLGARSR